MKTQKNKRKNFLGLFVHLDKIGKPQKQNEIDLSNPVTLITFTISYIIVIFFVIIGIPWHGSSNPIPPEDLDVAIPVFIFLYIFLAGGFYIRDKIKKKKDRDTL